MRILNSKFFTSATVAGAAFVLALSPFGLSVAQDEAPSISNIERAAEVSIGAQYIDVDPIVGFEQAVLRVSGPDGYALTRTVSAEQGASYITADLLFDAELTRQGNIEELVPWNNLPEGKYYFEIEFHSADGSTERQSGSFKVEGGAAVSPDQNSLSATQHNSVIGRIAGTLLDLLVPSAHAQGGDFDDYVSIRNVAGTGISRLNLNATDSIVVDADAWRVVNNADTNRFEIIEGSGTNRRLVILQGGHVGIGTDAPQDQLHVNDGGGFQLRLSDGVNTTRLDAFGSRFAIYGAGGRQFSINTNAPLDSMTVDSSGNVGLGTATPTNRLHLNGGNMTITGAVPTIAFDNTSGSLVNWAIGENADDFRIQQTSGTGPGFHFSIEEGGNTGMGTTSPNAPLHVLRGNGTASVLVEDTGSTSPLQMFSLKNNGSIRFTMANTTGHNWAFSTGSAGFSISRAGTGVEMLVRNNGNVEIAGDVTANGVLLTSARETKTDFGSVDEAALLDKVAQLDISQWRYKRDRPTERHIGPMAEDFQEVFGLGDGQHISAGDANGILFAATKALRAENQNLRAEVERIRSRLDALAAE